LAAHALFYAGDYPVTELRTFPDWGVSPGQLPSPDIDNAELAARLGAPSLRRSGRVILADDFETAGRAYPAWRNSLGTAPTMSGIWSYGGINSMLVGAAGANNRNERFIPSIKKENIGIEFFITQELGADFILEFGLLDMLTGGYVVGYLEISSTLERIRYIDDMLVDRILGKTWGHGVDGYWSNIKMVLDMNQQRYLRFSVNDQSFTAGENLYRVGMVVDLERSILMVRMSSEVLSPGRSWVDNMVITINEHD
jgi:hypothetical protein